MNDWMLDTNILLALTQPGTAPGQAAKRAAQELLRRNATLWIAPQTLSEFYATLTRPTRTNRNGASARNSGYGQTSADALREVAAMETNFGLLEDAPETFPTWKALIVATGITGTNCFDIRLAAIMQVYGIANLLTFNVADFTAVPGIHVETPANL